MSLQENVNAAYERRSSAWESALSQMHGWLTRECAGALRDVQDKSRLHVDAGRIKDRGRASAKLAKKIQDLDAQDAADAPDVEDRVRDIVGTKVLCKSTRDQKLIVEHLQKAAVRAGLGVVETKDYTSSPKASGYRAFHFIFAVDVPGEGDVNVEVQIKTRLQDAWGELTHENSYKSGSPINKTAFHDDVALTMANLLSEVDRLADCLAQDMESVIEDDDQGGMTPVAAAPVRVDVVTTGPRYALAEDARGDRGLIRAIDVRDLAGEHGLIRVDDYVRCHDVLEVNVVEGDRGRFFKPVRLPEHAE